jgi:hypothetical protein
LTLLVGDIATSRKVYVLPCRHDQYSNIVSLAAALPFQTAISFELGHLFINRASVMADAINVICDVTEHHP